MSLSCCWICSEELYRVHLDENLTVTLIFAAVLCADGDGSCVNLCGLRLASMGRKSKLNCFLEYSRDGERKQSATPIVLDCFSCSISSQHSRPWNSSAFTVAFPKRAKISHSMRHRRMKKLQPNRMREVNRNSRLHVWIGALSFVVCHNSHS